MILHAIYFLPTTFKCVELNANENSYMYMQCSTTQRETAGLEKLPHGTDAGL